MKHITLIALLLPLGVFSQDFSKLSFDVVKLKQALEKADAQVVEGKDIHLMAKGDATMLAAFVAGHGGVVKYRTTDILAIRIPAEILHDLLALPYLIKVEAHSQPLFFNDNVALGQTGVDTVHAGGGLLQQSYTGKGVIFGMIDSGIDPTHPDFKNDDGTTRIIAFWDQNDTTGTLAPYGYGREYTKLDIDAGAMVNYLDTTYGGHGSAVAGVAAGGGRARPDIRGMAPEADIIAVGINPSVLDYLDRTPSMLNIVDGINYIFTYADALNQPAVINISLGGIEGSHDGRDLPTQMINTMLEAKTGRVLVTSAGNAAGTRHHIQFNVNQDTLFTWFESMYSNSAVCKRDSGAYMSFYGDSVDVVDLQFSIAAEERLPCCTILDQTDYQPFIHTVGQVRKDTLWRGTDTIGIVSTFVEKVEDIYAFFMEIDSDSMDLLWRYSIAGSGKIDGWAGPLTARSCNSTYILNIGSVGGAAQIENYNNFVAPDNDQTIGTAYASSKDVITVGAYYARNSMLDVDSILRTYLVTPLRRASFSSLGPARDERIKPDITGPGSRIVTTQASQVLMDKLLNSRSTLYLGGQHAITDGTSFSSPAVAGIVALYLEKYPTADFVQVRAAMQSTADVETFMGALPNNSYGYGNINAYQMLLGAPAGIPAREQPLEAFVYPNPSNNFFTVQLPSGYSSSYSVKVFDLVGRLVYQQRHNAHIFTLDMQQPGTYLLHVVADNGASFLSKLMVTQ